MPSFGPRPKGGDVSDVTILSGSSRAFTHWRNESMMHRVKTALGLLVVALLFVAPLAAQQTTGKIEGTVSDQAGAPIANAQVFVVGTSFGAVTNDKGYYFVNNVPVGTFALRAVHRLRAVGSDERARARRPDHHREHQDAVVGRRADGHHGHRGRESDRAARPGDVEGNRRR